MGSKLDVPEVAEGAEEPTPRAASASERRVTRSATRSATRSQQSGSPGGGRGSSSQADDGSVTSSRTAANESPATARPTARSPKHAASAGGEPSAAPPQNSRLKIKLKPRPVSGDAVAPRANEAQPSPATATAQPLTQSPSNAASVDSGASTFLPPNDRLRVKLKPRPASGDLVASSGLASQIPTPPLQACSSSDASANSDTFYDAVDGLSTDHSLPPPAMATADTLPSASPPMPPAAAATAAAAAVADSCKPYAEVGSSSSQSTLTTTPAAGAAADQAVQTAMGPNAVAAARVAATTQPAAANAALALAHEATSTSQTSLNPASPATPPGIPTTSASTSSAATAGMSNATAVPVDSNIQIKSTTQMHAGRVGVIFDACMARHEGDARHQECPARVTTLMEQLEVRHDDLLQYKFVMYCTMFCIAIFITIGLTTWTALLCGQCGAVNGCHL